MSRAVLAIDQGTSGTKALVVDDDGSVRSCVELPLLPTYGDDGAVEQDPEAMWASVRDAGRAAVDDAGVPIAAVGLANQGESVLAWDPGSGDPLTPVVVWQDRRSAGVCEELAERAGELAAISGLPLDPYFAASKMTWLRRHHGGGGVVTTSDAWLAHRLTGAFVTDAATASRTALLDLDTVAWSPVALEAFGLAHETLPDVVACDAVVGTTTVFGGEVPLAGLAVDQQAALLAEGALAAGDAKCTYGTGAFLLVNTGGQARRSAHGLAASVAWVADGSTSYCLDGQVYTVASAVRWLVDLGVLRAAEDLDAVAATVPDAGGVVFVPALAGLGAPWWRGEARGSLTGLGLGTSAGHLVRALIDGVAAQVVAAVRAGEADTGTPVTSLRVDGGLTRSRAVLQAQADLLQAPVEVYPSPHATALGVAALARHGAGLSGPGGLAGLVGAGEGAVVVEPRASAAEAAERMAAFECAVAQVAS